MFINVLKGGLAANHINCTISPLLYECSLTLYRSREKSV